MLTLTRQFLHASALRHVDLVSARAQFDILVDADIWPETFFGAILS